MTRLALLTEIPAPFRIPLFNALAERLDLGVTFLRSSQPTRRYRLHEDELRFEWNVLPGLGLGESSRWLIVNGGVRRALGRADVVLLGGWNQPAFWEALVLAKATRRPAAVWVESTLADARPGGLSTLKRAFARAADAFVVPGTASERYVRTLVPRARLAVAPNAVDSALFAGRLGDREQLRAEFGLTRACVLYVGRLAREKGVDLLLEAARGLDAEVVVAGSGPEEASLRAAAPENVRFLGQVERNDLPGWYAAADVLCLPSRSEPWGFPLNEGASAGLPLVATDAVGAAWDLIEDGVNGFRVASGDPGALRTAVLTLLGDGALRERARTRSHEIAGRFTAEAWADAVVELTAALTRGPS